MKRCVALLVVSPPPVLSLVAQSTCRIFAPGVLRLGPRWPCWRAEAGLTAAIPMDNPYCSCQLTCGPVGVQRQRGSEERSAHAADKAGQDRTRVHTTSTSRTMTHTRSRSHRHTHTQRHRHTARDTDTQPEPHAKSRCTPSLDRPLVSCTRFRGVRARSEPGGISALRYWNRYGRQVHHPAIGTATGIATRAAGARTLKSKRSEMSGWAAAGQMFSSTAKTCIIASQSEAIGATALEHSPCLLPPPQEGLHFAVYTRSMAQKAAFLCHAAFCAIFSRSMASLAGGRRGEEDEGAGRGRGGGGQGGYRAVGAAGESTLPYRPAGAGGARPVGRPRAASRRQCAAIEKGYGKGSGVSARLWQRAMGKGGGVSARLWRRAMHAAVEAAATPETRPAALKRWCSPCPLHLHAISLVAQPK